MYVKPIALACLAGLFAVEANAKSIKTNSDDLKSRQHQAALLALDRRIHCAAYYRYSFELLQGRPPTDENSRLVRTYDAVGKNMLIQASAIGGAVGSTKFGLQNKFDTALRDLRTQIDNRASVYNRISGSLHSFCQSLIVR